EINHAAFPNRAKRRCVCNYALEHSANCPRRITRGSRSPRKAVSQLLVADLWLFAAPRPYPRRSTGFDPKIFCISALAKRLGYSRAGERTLTFVLLGIGKEFPRKRTP